MKRRRDPAMLKSQGAVVPDPTEAGEPNAMGAKFPLSGFRRDRCHPDTPTKSTGLITTASHLSHMPRRCVDGPTRPTGTIDSDLK
jgi:hypothetical protein